MRLLNWLRDRHSPIRPTAVSFDESGVRCERSDGLVEAVRLTDQERRLFACQLEEILTWAESLQAIDVGETEALTPTAAPPELREDQPRDGLEPGRVLAGAPDAAEGLFRVPRVIRG